MGTRGRRSGASLSVISADGIVALRRPDPPSELTDEQAEEWRRVVNRLPADWFPAETHALLTQYCRHVVAARRIAQLVNALETSEDFEVTQYDKLLAMQEREGRAMSSLATRMRLTQQATFDKEKKKPKGATRKPWEDIEG